MQLYARIFRMVVANFKKLWCRKYQVLPLKRLIMNFFLLVCEFCFLGSWSGSWMLEGKKNIGMEKTRRRAAMMRKPSHQAPTNRGSEGLSPVSVYIMKPTKPLMYEGVVKYRLYNGEYKMLFTTVMAKHQSHRP